MLTIKKQGLLALAFVAASLLLTACGPPGVRALHRGDRLIKSGDYDGAIAALQTATNLLAKDPTNVLATAYNLLGLAYHHSATNPASAATARQYYYTALMIDRNLAMADYNLGCLELEQNNLPAARNALITYTTLHRDPGAQLKLGAACYRIAIRMPAGSAISVAERERQANFDLARKSYSNAGALDPTAESANNIAVIDLLRRPNPNRATISNALVEVKTALRRDPGYPPALLNLAVLYDPAGPYKVGTAKESLEAYKDYLSANPTAADAPNVALIITNIDSHMRFQLQRPGQTSDIEPETLEPATGKLTVTPARSNPPATTRGTAVTHANPTTTTTTTVANPAKTEPVLPPPKIEEALPVQVDTNTVTSAFTNQPVLPETENRAVVHSENTPSNTPMSSTLVRQPSVLSRIFGGKPKTTETAGEAGAGAMGNVTPLPAQSEVIHYIPPSASTDAGNRAEADRFVKEAAAARGQFHWTDAMSAYRQAVQADPSDFDACEGLGIAAIEAKDYDAALSSLHHALLIASDSADARYDYAWTLEKKSYFSDAASELEKLLEIHPGEVRAHLLVGTLYSQRLGQPDLARGHYQEVLRLDPQNKEAAKIRLWLQNNPGP